MARTSRKRLIAALCYLALLFAGIGLIYRHIQLFEGQLLVVKEHAESTVVAAAGGGGLPFVGMQRAMPLDVILAENPGALRRYLDDSRAYNAVVLPFRVRVDGVEVHERFPPAERIEITDGAGSETLSWEDGARVEIAGRAYTMRAVRPWAGLVRHPRGHAVGVVSLREGGDPWRENIFVHAEHWTHLEDGAGLYLAWFEDEEAAESALKAGRRAVPGGRWGVRDRGAVHWFNNFAPGTGLTRSDGAAVELIERAEGPEGPSITVRVTRGGASVQEMTVPPNAGDPVSPVIFEAPEALSRVLLLHAWRDGAAWAGWFEEGAPAARLRIEETESARVPGTGIQVRLDQLMRGAIAIEGRGDPVYEAVLEDGGGGFLRIREGSGERVGDARVRFRREPAPPRVSYALRFLDRAGGEREAVLAPGGKVRHGDWVFEQAPNVWAEESALLEARRTLGGPGRLFGMALVALGSAGLVVLRFRPQ